MIDDFVFGSTHFKGGRAPESGVLTRTTETRVLPLLVQLYRENSDLHTHAWTHPLLACSVVSGKFLLTSPIVNVPIVGVQLYRESSDLPIHAWTHPSLACLVVSGKF